jgi:hypothetical protein
MPRWRLVFRWNMPEIGLVGEPLEWNLMPAMTLKVTFKDSKVAKVA